MNLRISIIGAAMTISLALNAQNEKNVDSKITGVTVFLSRAQVTREMKTRVEPGKTNLVIGGLTSQLDPQSIQVAGKGAVILLGTSHRQNYISDLNLPKGLRLLKDSVELSQKQLSLEQSQKEILNKEEQMLISNQKIGGGNQNITVAELKAMADFYRSRLGEIVSGRMKQDEKIKKLNERIARLQAQINSQNELRGRNSSEIVVSVSAETSTEVSLELNYIVANAGWVPIYDLRASNTHSPIQLSYKANVYQSSGEEWKNVHLKLSTGNPNLGGLKPELNSQYVDFYSPASRNVDRRADGLRKSTSAPQAVAMDAKEELQEVVEISEYVSTVQTALNTEFDIALPYTVNSSNQPTLVDIRSYEVKASYQYAVAPKLDPDAFLIAKAIGWEEYNLLPGEANIFFEGTYVGKTFVDPNSIKDTLSVSLGRDKRIVVKREKVKDFTSRKAIGTNIRETYAYEISVRSTKQEVVRIVVEDQIPVSKNSQIEVTTVDVVGANYNKDTGKMTWTWSLSPNETKKTIFKFEVKYPKDRQISGL